MAKSKYNLIVRLPPYLTPRNKWRRLIHESLEKAVKEQRIKYDQNIRLKLSVILYLGKNEIDKHDVDNRLKDVMDALQGRAGGSKKEHVLKSFIPNDNQIFKVTIEKRIPPKQSKGWMHLQINRYK